MFPTEAEKEKYESSAKLYTQEQCLAILDYLMEAQNKMRFASSGRLALETILLYILRTHQRVSVELLVRKLSDLEQKIAATSPSSPPASSVQTPPLNTQQQPIQPKPKSAEFSMSIDPLPTPADLGIKPKPQPPAPAKPPTPPPIPRPAPPPPTAERPAAPTAPAKQTPPIKKLTPQEQSRFDTLLQFAAVELEGTVKKIH